MTWLLGLVMALGYLWWTQRLPAQKSFVVSDLARQIPAAVPGGLPLASEGFPGGEDLRCPGCGVSTPFESIHRPRYETVRLCSCRTRYRIRPWNRLMPLSPQPSAWGLQCPWCQVSVEEAVAAESQWGASLRRCCCGEYYRMPDE